MLEQVDFSGGVMWYMLLTFLLPKSSLDWTTKRSHARAWPKLGLGFEEDSWESLGLQGDTTSSSERKSVLNIHWMDWCWSWNSSTLATWCEEPTHWKRPWCWKNWGQEEKGATEDEKFGWHHRLNGHELEQTLGESEGQGSLEHCSPQSRRVGHDSATKQQ